MEKEHRPRLTFAELKKIVEGLSRLDDPEAYRLMKDLVGLVASEPDLSKRLARELELRMKLEREQGLSPKEALREARVKLKEEELREALSGFTPKFENGGG